MKRFMTLLILFIYLFSYQPTIFAAGSSSEPSVYDDIHKGDKKSTQSPKIVENRQSPSIFPLFIKFIFSFILVIALLFLILRYLTKKSRTMQGNGLVLPLGGQTLGNNRSMQVMLIGQTIYIVGVGESVTLIRSISQGEEYQHLLESYENQAEGLSSKWLTKDTKKIWNTVFRKHIQNIQQENGEE